MFSCVLNTSRLCSLTLFIKNKGWQFLSKIYRWLAALYLPNNMHTKSGLQNSSTITELLLLLYYTILYYTILYCTITIALSYKFNFFGATPMANGSTWARYEIGDTEATYTTAHVNVGSLTYWERPEIEPATRNLMVPSRIRFCCPIMGTPFF